jgi:hypothetical protein
MQRIIRSNTHPILAVRRHPLTLWRAVVVCGVVFGTSLAIGTSTSELLVPALLVCSGCSLTLAVWIVRWQRFVLEIWPNRMVYRYPLFMDQKEIYYRDGVVGLTLRQALTGRITNSGTLEFETHQGKKVFSNLWPFDELRDLLE